MPQLTRLKSYFCIYAKYKIFIKIDGIDLIQQRRGREPIWNKEKIIFNNYTIPCISYVVLSGGIFQILFSIILMNALEQLYWHSCITFLRPWSAESFPMMKLHTKSIRCIIIKDSFPFAPFWFFPPSYALVRHSFFRVIHQSQVKYIYLKWDLFWIK